MADIDSLINLFSSKTIDTISFYIKKITDLYCKPLKVWRQIISQNKKSFNYFIFYLLFYGLIIFILTPNMTFFVKIIIIQFIVNFQPFFILLVPFLFFSRIWRQRIKINRLFRLVFIFWLQAFPFTYIPIFIAEEYGVESPYIISDNAIVITDIFLIIVIPILTNLSIFKKMIWILVNYIFLNLSLIFLSYLNKFPDILTIRNKIEYYKPVDEFLEFESMYKDSDLYMCDLFYVLYYKTDTGKINSTQFATFNLLDELIESEEKINNNIHSKIDNFIKYGDTTSIKVRELKHSPFYDKQNMNFRIKLNNEELLSRKKLDSFRETYNAIFYHDLKLTDSLMKYAKFEENKKLFKNFHDYLSLYDSIYRGGPFIKRIVDKKNINHTFSVNDGNTLVLLNMNENFIRKNKSALIDNYEKVLGRFEMSTFASRYLYFPFHSLRSKKTKSLAEEFKSFRYLTK